MNYIVFDLEFNQGYNFTNETKNTINPKCPFEIIQIGAIKLNNDLETIETLDILVKPQVYPDLNPFVKELTGITMNDLDAGVSFNEMYNALLKFIGADSSVLCVWGATDVKELFQNIEYYKLDALFVPKEYINIQSYASTSLNCKKGINIGLSNATESLNIPIKNKFHNALNDAYYTAEIFKIIYSKKIKPNIYIRNKHTLLNRSNTQTYKTDFPKLINQLEKMFKREMTVDERSIIKLAYIMGKTNQFQININPIPISKK